MFMAPETLPVRAPETSVQKTQLGLTVMSAPNIAKLKAITAESIEWACVTPASPIAASEKPIMAGSRRDHGLSLEP
jgi:hypothetical protein